MEVNQKKFEAAKSCFDYNKNLNTVHVTGDMECFADRNAAVNHARALEDKTIDVFDRGAEDIELDFEGSDDTSDEAITLPDYDLAKAKAEGSETDGNFAKNTPPSAPEPVAQVTPVIEQLSAMDTLNKDPDQVSQTGIIAESGHPETVDLNNVQTVAAVTPVIAEPGQPAVLAIDDTAGTSIQNRVMAEPGAPAIMAEPTLTPAQKRANTIAANKAALAQGKAE